MHATTINDEMKLSYSISPPSIAQYTSELKKQGYRSVPGALGTVWLAHETFSMDRFPTFCLNPPDPAELKGIFWQERMAVVSYLLEPDLLRPANAILYICDDQAYHLDKLPKPAQRAVRRALKSLEITFIDWATVNKSGFTAFRDTRNRAGLSDGTIDNFTRWCESSSKIDNYVVGAWKEDILVGYMTLIVIDDFVLIPGSCSANEHLDLRPNDGLAYFVLRYFLASHRCRVVSFGLSSLQPGSNKTGLHQFKTKIGFQARPVHRAFVFHPLIRPWINRVTMLGLKAVLKLNPNNRKLRKSVGVLETVLEKGRSLVNDTQ